MKLIDITCPKCKATMEVDEKRKQVTCKYCDNKILIDDEVKKVKHIMVGQIDDGLLVCSCLVLNINGVVFG